MLITIFWRIDFTIGNLATRLEKSFDSWEVQDFYDLFGEPNTEPIRALFKEIPCVGPKFATEAMNLGLLPPECLSTSLCLIDFDQAFLSKDPPIYLLGIPPMYLAPESIFELKNGPPSDVWALGCALFSMRCAYDLFVDVAYNDPFSAAAEMWRVLGELPEKWRTVPFYQGYPIHEELGEDIDIGDHVCRDFSAQYERKGKKLLELVKEFRVPLVWDAVHENDGMKKFSVFIPERFPDKKAGNAFFDKSFAPIKEEDALLFADLLRRIFTYNSKERLSPQDVLVHPWLQST